MKNKHGDNGRSAIVLPHISISSQLKDSKFTYDHKIFYNIRNLFILRFHADTLSCVLFSFSLCILLVLVHFKMISVLFDPCFLI